ncbi:hypothetical protein K488DRAFT_72623 [Vararia minispora EC-137]|uniref:Uncharacterized protein n=1 Tax=Vararia minispora EC-137 TaxID=1314806 RepID=A0ACB8QE39_9AGAM|nr:hypothetical protein K488DRAFT_72623 [Vararia minispora EC-137]
MPLPAGGNGSGLVYALLVYGLVFPLPSPMPCQNPTPLPGPGVGVVVFQPTFQSAATLRTHARRSHLLPLASSPMSEAVPPFSEGAPSFELVDWTFDTKAGVLDLLTLQPTSGVQADAHTSCNPQELLPSFFDILGNVGSQDWATDALFQLGPRSAGPGQDASLDWAAPPPKRRHLDEHVLVPPSSAAEGDLNVQRPQPVEHDCQM